MSNREISLKVADARQRDIGHGKVRIDNDTMQKLGLTAGRLRGNSRKEDDRSNRMAGLRGGPRSRNYENGRTHPKKCGCLPK